MWASFRNWKKNTEFTQTLKKINCGIKKGMNYKAELKALLATTCIINGEFSPTYENPIGFYI